MKNIFISSTFIDMQAERDMVQERVVPVIREAARKYGDNVGVIDLRWGVDTSTLETEEGAQKVLKVCLDEIDRSHPYMLIFLGERYGTMMREDQIERSVRNRSDKYVTEDYVKSITALEVEYGALSEKYGDLDRCVVCFREPVLHMMDGEEKNLYAEHTEKGREKLQALKERITHDLGDVNRLITYSAVWDKSARKLVNFQSEGQPLEEVLINCFIDMFQEEWEQYEALSWQDKEQLAFRALMGSKLRSFVGREALLEEYYESAVNGTCPMVLQGEVGSGKTAIMCKLVNRLKEEGKNVFAFFSCAGAMSTRAELLVKQMVYYMENLLGVKERFGEEPKTEEEIRNSRIDIEKKNVQYTEWVEYLRGLCFRMPAQEKVYFCIDALDQLHKDEHVEKLDFFWPAKNVQIIASCTDTFELPVTAMMQYEVKSIPALSETDARVVVEGILASYSRNTYEAIEQEILKKKNVGNPLYISLLIQRLNMMDAEELRCALNEEEIIALGTGIIRDMPDELEAATVSIIQNGIDKISDNEEQLQEILNYLAVSRDGLRMQDLQKIFESKSLTFHTLDFTLLMKYLDMFFYVHEDDRIDFTHKSIRQGLVKRIAEKKSYEETIKEYLKTLYREDILRVQEGMYYARILSDEILAIDLIAQADESKQENLLRAIKIEAVEDEGGFYCQLIEGEKGEESVVCDFFQYEFLTLLSGTKEEMAIKVRIAETLLQYREAVNKNCGNEDNLHDLWASYRDCGHAFSEIGQFGNAISYYEKAMKCGEVLYEENTDEVNLWVLYVSYSNMGNALNSQGKAREALSYLDKALGCGEALHEKVNCKRSLWDLMASYGDKGRALIRWGKPEEALPYYGTNLKYAEILCEKDKTEESHRYLLGCYGNMGHLLVQLERLEEALFYCKKALQCAEELHEKDGDERSLRDLGACYNYVGNALNGLEHSQEAVSYWEKALKCAEVLYEIAGSESSLRDLSVIYGNMGTALSNLDRPEGGLSYWKKALKCAETLYEGTRSEDGLQLLATCYSYIGHTLKTLSRPEEALASYKKAMQCREELHEMIKSVKSLEDLWASYNYIGHLLREQVGLEEALPYYQKALECGEVMHEKRGTEASLRELLVSYNNMERVMGALGRSSESVSYYGMALKCKELLYGKSESGEALRDLAKGYSNMGNGLWNIGHPEEALPYYAKSLEYLELLHEKIKCEATLHAVVTSCENLGRALKYLGRLDEAVCYFEKAQKYKEVF